MLRKPLTVVALALFLTTALTGPIRAQDDQTSGADQPPALQSVQVVPVTVDVAVPVEGETVTASVPLSAEVSVRVQLVQTAAGSAEPFPVVAVEDAALLLPVLSEMPVGFVQSGEPVAASSNEDIAAHYDDPAAFLKFLDEDVGRQGGAYVQFTNSQFAPFAGGNGYIGASVLVMADAEGADLYLTGAMERELERSDATGAVYRVSAPRLGDNSILYTEDATENNTQWSDYTLWVRANNALLTLDARAPRNMGNVDQLLALARTVLARGAAQPEQEGPVKVVSEAAPEADAAAQEGATPQATPTPAADEANSQGSLWDLPHYRSTTSDMMDIGGFKVQVDGVALFDFAQVKAFDADNERFYDNSAFQDATVFGLLYLTMTNEADVDLSLPSSDAVLVVGSEQVQLADFQHVADNPFGQALLPGVERNVALIFALTETSFADLGPSVDVRLQMRGPITEKYEPLVRDAKYRASLTLTPTP